MVNLYHLVVRNTVTLSTAPQLKVLYDFSLCGKLLHPATNQTLSLGKNLHPQRNSHSFMTAALSACRLYHAGPKKEDSLWACCSRFTWLAVRCVIFRGVRVSGAWLEKPSACRFTHVLWIYQMFISAQLRINRKDLYPSERQTSISQEHFVNERCSDSQVLCRLHIGCNVTLLSAQTLSKLHAAPHHGNL